MLDLIGIPIDIYREHYVIRATSMIGIYLGTVEQAMEGDVACWTVVVATSSISLIPHQIALMMGRLEVHVDVIPRKCVQSKIYKPDELPQPKERFLPPIVQSLSAILAEGLDHNEDDHFIGSRKVLEELCQGFQFDALPIGVQAMLKGARSMV